MNLALTGSLTPMRNSHEDDGRFLSIIPAAGEVSLPQVDLELLRRPSAVVCRLYVNARTHARLARVYARVCSERIDA